MYSWMGEANIRKHRAFLDKGQSQKAHLLAKGAFTSYCFHLSGEQRQGRGQWIANCEVADVEHWLSPHLATPQKWNFAMGSCTWSARLFIAMHLQQPFNKRRESTEEQPFNKSR